jgi:hypothetical protein
VISKNLSLTNGSLAEVANHLNSFIEKNNRNMIAFSKITNGSDHNKSKEINSNQSVSLLNKKRKLE